MLWLHLIHSAKSHWIIYSIDSLRTLDSFSNKSLNHLLNWFTQNTWFIQQRVIESYTQLICSEHLIHSATSHWIIYSIDSLRTLDSFSNESLNHILNWFTQNTRFIQQQVIESSTQLIHSEHLIHSAMSHWIIYSIDSLRTLDSFSNESLNHILNWFTQNTWLIQECM